MIFIPTAFPSPCGDYGSYRNSTNSGSSTGWGRFPSPCGDYGSYQDEVFTKVQVDFGQFPSPCGDYGSYRHGTRSYCSFKLESFRPLAGIMVLIAKTASLITSAETLVSVPLRGLWFLSGREKVMRKEVYESFRPLAGIMVLINLIGDDLAYLLQQFPSPCGDYGSYPASSPDKAWFCNSFPSPCGDYGSYHISTRNGSRPLLIVSVPLRGLWFLSSR